MDTVIELQTDKDGQHLTLPPEFRLDADHAILRKDPITGDLVLSASGKRGSMPLDELWKLLDEADFPKDFLADRNDNLLPDRREEL